MKIPFWLLTKNNKRKAIARDVLARLETNQLRPAHQGYVITDHADSDLQSLVNQGEKCTVCALGGAVVSIAHFEDKIKTNTGGRVPVSSSLEQISIQKRLRQIFGDELVELIECAYEGTYSSTYGLHTGILTYDEIQAALRFNTSFGSENTQLFKAIWLQIAATGTFDPSKT